MDQEENLLLPKAKKAQRLYDTFSQLSYTPKNFQYSPLGQLNFHDILEVEEEVGEKENIEKEGRVSLFIFVYELVAVMVMSLLPPFLPLEMQALGYDTSQAGLILSASAIGNILTAPFFPSLLSTWPKRKLLLINTLLTVLLLFIQVLVFQLKVSENTFLFINFISRAFLGAIDGLKGSLLMDIYIKNFPESSQAFNFTIYMFAFFMGALFGHFCGGVFYRSYGSTGPFYFSIFTTAIFIPLIYMILPQEIDQVQSQSQKNQSKNFFKSIRKLMSYPQTFSLFS